MPDFWYFWHLAPARTLGVSTLHRVRPGFLFRREPELPGLSGQAIKAWWLWSGHLLQNCLNPGSKGLRFWDPWLGDLVFWVSAGELGWSWALHFHHLRVAGTRLPGSMADPQSGSLDETGDLQVWIKIAGWMSPSAQRSCTSSPDPRGRLADHCSSASLSKALHCSCSSLPARKLLWSRWNCAMSWDIFMRIGLTNRHLLTTCFMRNYWSAVFCSLSQCGKVDIEYQGFCLETDNYLWYYSNSFLSAPS